MRFASISHTRMLRYAGLFTWACVGIPLLRQAWHTEELLGSPDHVGWWLSYIAFGLAYWAVTNDLSSRRLWPLKLPLLIVMNASAVAISYFSQSGLSGILLLLIAGVLPWLLPVRIGLAWLIVQNFSLVPVFLALPDYGLLDALLQSGLYLGFSSFSFVTSVVARAQAEAREEQRRLNSELRATRTLLAESSRIAERVRISRDLHDLVGHHLTALSLNLEVASHLVSGRAQEHVRQAQSVARLLLGDVREVVNSMRAGEGIDLTAALNTLVEGIPSPRIHLELPEPFAVDDPRRAQVLLRCAQEIITNAVKHAQAANLWLSFDLVDGEIQIRARDDGRGANQMKIGNGLTGMRERLAEFGGRLSVAMETGKGFSLEAHLPVENTI